MNKFASTRINQIKQLQYIKDIVSNIKHKYASDIANTISEQDLVKLASHDKYAYGAILPALLGTLGGGAVGAAHDYFSTDKDKRNFWDSAWSSKALGGAGVGGLGGLGLYGLGRGSRYVHGKVRNGIANYHNKNLQTFIRDSKNQSGPALSTEKQKARLAKLHEKALGSKVKAINANDRRFDRAITDPRRWFGRGRHAVTDAKHYDIGGDKLKSSEDLMDRLYERSGGVMSLTNKNVKYKPPLNESVTNSYSAYAKDRRAGVKAYKDNQKNIAELNDKKLNLENAINTPFNAGLQQQLNDFMSQLSNLNPKSKNYASEKARLNSLINPLRSQQKQYNIDLERNQRQLSSIDKQLSGANKLRFSDRVRYDANDNKDLLKDFYQSSSFSDVLNNQIT